MPSPADLAFLRFQATGRADALGEVFDATAADLLRVAAHLAPDLHTAEDLVQETFLAAIESKASFTAGHDVAAWLLGILRNRARRRWRSASRAAAIAIPELADAGGDDPAGHALAHELTAEVDAAVQLLPECYRPVLRLHLRHGLTPTEIALALERPAGTVRTQLGRGLALLRAKLPRGLAVGALALPGVPRGLPAVRAAVLHAASAAAPAAAAVIAVSLPLLGLPMKKLVLTAAAAAILLGSAAWQLGAFATAEPPVDPPAAASLHAAARSTPPSATPPVLRPAPAPAPSRVAVPAPEPTGRQHGTLVVRVRWKEDDTPAALVAVKVFDWQRPNPFLTHRSGVTGAEGTVRIERVPAGEVQVVTNDDATVKVVVPAGGEATADALEPRWGTVRGVVVDAGGAPVAGATVVRSDSMNHMVAHPIVTTGADGTFTFPLGEQQYVAARKAGHVDSYYARTNAAKGETVDVRLCLRGPAASIAGKVRDARQAPVLGALVTAGTGGTTTVLADGEQVTTTPAPRATTAADGSFRLDGLAAGQTTLLVRAPDFGIARRNLVLAAGETTEVAITLEDGTVLTGRIVDERGRAVADATIAVGGYARPDSNFAATAADGSFRVDSLPAGRVEVRAGKAKVGRASATLELVAGTTSTWDATLVMPPQVTGRVVDEAGAPVRQVWVSVASLDANESRTAGAWTTEDGTFAIECSRREPLRLAVLVRRDTFPSLELDDVVPGGEPIRVTLPAAAVPSARLRGTLVLPDGRPATGATLLLHHGRRGLATEFALDPASGAFTVGPFPPGEYHALVRDRHAPAVHLGPIRLAAGGTQDVGRVVVGESGSLNAAVLGEDGKPLPSGTLHVLTRSGIQVGSAEITDGSARVARLAPGDYLVHAAATAVQPVRIGAGLETALELRPRAGILHPVAVREQPRAGREPTAWVEVDVLDAAATLVDREAPAARTRAARGALRVLMPPHGGTVVVRADGREVARRPLAAGDLEFTVR